MSSGIEGKVVAITEAGDGGIGAAAARLLAAQGAHVVLGSRAPAPIEALAEAIVQAGGSAQHHTVDVTDRRSTQRFISLAHAWFGRLDVIVNSAGLHLPSALETLRVDDWDRMIDVNLRGALHGIAAGLPLLQARGRGQIINIVAPDGGDSAVHEATQQALRAISEGLRRELVPALRVTLLRANPAAAQALVVAVEQADVPVRARPVCGLLHARALLKQLQISVFPRRHRDLSVL
jgi:NADP-dependent 3-hydroxy acid dehydrogenase YdfG